MKISDNMLRVINHAYINNKPMNFLIKAGIVDISNDKEFLDKAYKTMTLLSSIIGTLNTSSERDFYAFTISTVQFNNRIIKEKSIDSKAITIKEYISANGVVYSDFLDYVYEDLIKYIPNKLTEGYKNTLKKSLDQLYKALYKIADLREQQLLNYSMIDVLNDLNLIQEHTLRLSEVAKNLKLTIGSIKNTIKSIDKIIKEAIKTITIDISNNDNLPIDIELNLSIMKEEIERELELVKSKLLKEYTIKVITEIKEKIRDSVDVNDYEMYQDITNTLDNILTKLTIRENATTDNLNIVLKLNEITDTLDTLFNNIKGDSKLLKNTENKLSKVLNNFNTYID